MSTPIVRNPRADAQALLPTGHEARVLEPSPPANTDPDWFADDPTDPAGATGRLVSPTPDGEITWYELGAGDPAIATHAHDHWLVDRPLASLPEGFASTRDALHQVAFFALAPKRFAVTGKLGLRWTRGGFGTPFYATNGGDEQVRVERDLLVVQSGDEVRWIRPTNLAGACEFLAIAFREAWFDGFHDPPAPAAPDAPLHIDGEAADALADWFGFATAVLEQLRRTAGATDVGRVQLWPEHFDPAVELGDADAGHRASYGASPGDDAHAEPYLFVAAWGDIDRAEPYWNDATFNGASLSYQELLGADDPATAALDFLRRGHALLTAA